VVPSAIFKELIKKISLLPNAGLLGPRLINGTGKFLPESKRNIPSPLTSLRRLFGIKLGIVKSYYANHISESSIQDVDVLVGAFLMTKRTNFIKVGQFDEDYFIYGEDMDLSYRYKKVGFQNYYIGSLVAIHYKGESITPNAKFIRLFYTSMRIFYKKHFKSKTILDRLISIVIHLVSMIHSFKRFGKKKHSINRYYLVSKDDVLLQQLKCILTKKVVMVDTLMQEDLGDPNIEIIFDHSFVSFHAIIKYMLALQKENITFKIKPKGRNYILGSNFNDEKGEVIVF